MVFSPQGSYLTTGVVEPPDPHEHHVAHFITDETRFYLQVEENQTACRQGGNYSTSQPILAPISSNRQQEREANQVSASSLDEMDDEMPAIPAHQREAEDHLYAEFDPMLEEAKEQEEEARQAEIDLMSIEEFALSQAQAAREPHSLPQPVAVSAEEKAAHELTHHGKPPWCTHCVAGKDKRGRSSSG